MPEPDPMLDPDQLPIEPEAGAPSVVTRLRRVVHPPGVIAVIAAGGAIGGSGRWAIEKAIPTPTLGFPWATFVINLTGAFALALLVVLMTERWRPRTYLRPFIGIGIIGAFTTFSTLVVEVDQLARHGAPLTAAVYVLASIVGGLALGWLGLRLGRTLSRPPASPPPAPSSPMSKRPAGDAA